MSVFLVYQKKGKKRKAPSSHGIEDKEERSPFLRLYKNTCSKIQGVEKLTSKLHRLLLRAPTFLPSHVFIHCWRPSIILTC
jgi:hypothetical protein